MGKYANTDWKVVVNDVDLSNFAFDVAIGDEKEKLDVSGFNILHTRDYLPGQRDQEVTVQFRNDFTGTTSVFYVLNEMYAGGSIFPFFVQPLGLTLSGTAGTAYPENPLYGGSAELYQLPLTGTLNEVGEITATFAPASNSAFTWGTTAP